MSEGIEWGRTKVLVTGASGFKGSWLCAVLARAGATVFGTARRQQDPLSAYSLLDLGRHIAPIRLDITDRRCVQDMLREVSPDVVFHLAAQTIVPEALRDPCRTFEVNTIGTLNVIEACRQLRVCDRLLICSTDHVFGSVASAEAPPDGFPEDHPLSYGSPYDTSKTAAELIVRSYYEVYRDELPALGITRSANVFGYGDVNQRRVIPAFVNASLDRGVIPLTYRYTGRQFIHITDVTVGYIRAASALARARESGESFVPTFHFALERYQGVDTPYVTLEHLANVIASIVGSRVDDTGCADYAPRESRTLTLDCTRTREYLRWEPKTTLETGVSALTEWYRRKGDLTALRKLIEKDVDDAAAAI